MNSNQKSAFIWAVVAFIIATIMVVKNNSAMAVNAGFFLKTFAIMVGTILGFVGAMLGDAIRRFALPDGFFTPGGMGSILKTKLFWMVGPQIIGLLIGVVLGAALVLK